jgi:hypothetical protein
VNGVLGCIGHGAPSLAWFHHLSQHPLPTSFTNILANYKRGTSSKGQALTKAAADATHKSFKWIFDITQVR